MRVTGEDEGVDAQFAQLVDSFGDLLVTADQSERRSAADEAEAAPHVGLHFQISVAGDVFGYPAFDAGGAHRVTLGCTVGGPLVDEGPAFLDLGPRGFFGVPGYDVDAYGEFRRASQFGRVLPHPVDLGSEIG
eukprot:gene28875-35180_t